MCVLSRFSSDCHKIWNVARSSKRIKFEIKLCGSQRSVMTFLQRGHNPYKNRNFYWIAFKIGIHVGIVKLE